MTSKSSLISFWNNVVEADRPLAGLADDWTLASSEMFSGPAIKKSLSLWTLNYFEDRLRVGQRIPFIVSG